MYRILLVEDEQEIGVASQKYLTSKDFVVTLVQTGTAAKAALARQSFDCIVLDILLPDDNGLRLCERIRKTANIPILFLSCLDEEADVLRGMLSGGDDYIKNPNTTGPSDMYLDIYGNPVSRGSKPSHIFPTK